MDLNIAARKIIAWYELRLITIESQIHFVVDIHKSAWEFCQKLLQNNKEEIADIMEIRKISLFTYPSTKERWGFGRKSEFIRSWRDGWVSVLFRLPDGSDMDLERITRELTEAMSTMYLVLTNLAIFQKEIDDYHSPQLITIADDGIILSLDLCKWLSTENPSQRYVPLYQWMEKVYRQIGGKIFGSKVRCLVEIMHPC